MGRKLERDENGRLPLSPRQQQYYDYIKTHMGNKWWSYDELSCLANSSSSTRNEYLRECSRRGWLLCESRIYEPTQRHRTMFHLPEEFIKILCGECGEWKIGNDDYLCIDCRQPKEINE